MTRSSADAPAAPETRALAGLIHAHRDALLREWREAIRSLPAARGLDRTALDDHIPLFLRELAAALRGNEPGSVRDGGEDASEIHGSQRFDLGFDIVEVVAEFNALRECIQQLAERNGLRLDGATGRTLHRHIDAAIGSAVDTFASQQADAARLRRQEYLAFVAHDLRTPLSVIRMAAEMLQLNLGEALETPGNARIMRNLHQNIDRLNALVAKVLREETFIGQDRLFTVKRTQVDLHELVQRCLDDLQPLADRALDTLANAVPPGLCADADADLLEPVLQNLVGNAIKYTTEGRIEVGCARGADGGVECWVRDTGIGIEPARLAHVFEPGETDGRWDGRGLGLALARQYVRSHGGELHVASTPGSGTEFRFDLPPPAEPSA